MYKWENLFANLLIYEYRKIVTTETKSHFGIDLAVGKNVKTTISRLTNSEELEFTSANPLADAAMARARYRAQLFFISSRCAIRRENIRWNGGAS